MRLIILSAFIFLILPNLAFAFQIKNAEEANRENQQNLKSNIISPRQGHLLIFDESLGESVLLGGYLPPENPLREKLWTWNGSHWKLISSEGPGARSLAGAVFDSKRKVIVLFGGIGIVNGNRYGDVWEWHKNNWTEINVAGPGPLDHHAMVFDSDRGKTVVYGGTDSFRNWITDTWEWDGTNWTRFRLEGPGKRAHHQMVYDKKRKRTVLFGGRDESGNYLNHTWEYDGKVWRQVSTEGPTPRARHRMAYDEERGVTVLYGGNAGNLPNGGGFNVVGNTWEWGGKNWTEIKTPGLGKRFMHAMTYDSKRKKIVLFGGSDGTQNFSDIWEWDGKTWENKKIKE